jgi:hypothetical protein
VGFLNLELISIKWSVFSDLRSDCGELRCDERCGQGGEGAFFMNGSLDSVRH